MRWRTILLVLLSLLLAASASPAKSRKGSPANKAGETDESRFSGATFSGLALRPIGPALTSGRVGDIAVDPRNRSTYYVAVASGGVWKTVNSGTTWTPIFDDQGSYSIGCVTIDPSNPLTVWVGTGENNSQRSVSYGDGVYRSPDGGKTWKRMGLENSEHIGKILVDPRDSNVVYVAAQGPLWSSGGDRGLYVTRDSGETWELLLDVGADTGVSDIAFDPRNPDVIYAAAYQRRRHVWTLINGGPESALYKTTDAGANWTRLERGLPKTDLGRIGIAVSPASPDVVYAIVEAEGDDGGFFRSVDAGSNWTKRSDYVSSSPQYYQELVPDPHDVDRVYSLDTWMQVTEDGGKTFRRAGGDFKHVDDHALWIDPADTDYLLAGCDGGVYESFDRADTWHFKANLPVTQFYRIAVDNDFPFYNVYGGTQDNFTLGGPARSTSDNGILNRDWFVTLGGDGFEPAVDPENPDIVYSQYQYGGLTRFDRRSGERIDIQPQPAPGEDALRWNWDSALIISPHSPTRLYFAAQRVFRSDDRGNNWKPVSPDLTRSLDRNRLEVMDRVQKVDAVAKNRSTSPYGNVVSLSESTRVEGLLYAGTDDGLVQVLEGEAWRKIETFPGVPEMSYVADLEASLHADDRVYAAFDNHKMGDFAPYLLRSNDRGKSWKSIAGDLPERGTVYTLAEDHRSPDLLFAGTEFGLYFTIDGGARWTRLQGGLPVVAVRDLEIQRRDEDLVVGTFGRGIYILDDYTPLRRVDAELLEREAELFDVERTWMFIPSRPLGLASKSLQGDSLYRAPNPPFGAILTYYLRDALETRTDRRIEAEKQAAEQDDPYRYPDWDELREEDREDDPAMVLTVTDADGNVVRRLTGPAGKGFHRVAWDLRYPAANPTRLAPPSWTSPFSDPPTGPMVAPGTYTVQLARHVDGESVALGEPREFETVPLGTATLPAADREALVAFQLKTARLQRAVLGARRTADEAMDRIAHLRKAALDTPGMDRGIDRDLLELRSRLRDLLIDLSGDPTIRNRSEPTPPSITQRVQRIVGSQWTSSSAPTGTNLAAYDYAAAAFGDVLTGLQRLVEHDLEALERRLEAEGAPWTPGRVPQWSPE